MALLKLQIVLKRVRWNQTFFLILPVQVRGLILMEKLLRMLIELSVRLLTHHASSLVMMLILTMVELMELLSLTWISLILSMMTRFQVNPLLVASILSSMSFQVFHLTIAKQRLLLLMR